MSGPWTRYGGSAAPANPAGNYVVGTPNPRLLRQEQRADEDQQFQRENALRAREDQALQRATADRIAAQGDRSASREDARDARSISNTSFDNRTSLRKEFTSRKEVQDFQTILPQIATSMRAAEKPNATGADDLSIIYSFGKVMDPGSVVREGELALASSTGSFADNLEGAASRVASGERLPDDVRKKLVEAMRQRGISLAQAYNQTRGQYKQMAERSGFNPEDIVLDHPARPYQQTEADFTDSPIGNFDGSIGARPSRRYRAVTPDGRQVEYDVPDDATEEQIRALTLAAVGTNYKNTPININPPSGGGQGGPTTPTPTGGAPAGDPDAALLGDIGQGVSEMARGFGQGVASVWDKAADWTASGLNAVGGLVGAPNIGTTLRNTPVGGTEQAGPINTADSIGAGTPGLDTLRSFGRFGGETVATLPLAALRGGALVQGAAGGALLSEKRDATGILMDMGMGALAARGGQAAFDAAAGVARPNLSAAQRTLLNENIRLTSGQMAGPGSQGKRLEDIAAGVPLIQGPVQQAQRRAQVDLNRAAANRALRPINERLPRNMEVGHDSVAFAGNRLRQAYADVLPRLQGSLDNTFQSRVSAIRQRASLPPEYDGRLDQLQNELSNAFTGAGQNGAYSGRTLRDTSERLGDLARGWRSSDDPYLRVVGDVADQYRQQLHALARRQNPSQAARLRNIDRGYASLVRLERAAAGTADGVATPAQYDAAVRGSDSSVRRRQSARGQALDQDLSSAARQVMQNTAAQGGSRDVNSLIGMGALATGVLGMQPAALVGAGGIMGGRALYGDGAQDAIRALMSRNPGMTAQRAALLLRAGSRVAPVAAPAAIETVRD